MSKEALKMAMEALEEAADAIDSWGSYASGYFQVKHDLESDIIKTKSAITAIKESLAQPEQEPVAWWNKTKDTASTDPVHRNNADCQPLYTTPPQRKPLTDEEVWNVIARTTAGDMPYSYRIARAIEAAHGIYATTERKGEA